MSGDILCSRCYHPASQHWPNDSDRPTTACVYCLDGQIVSGPLDWRGFCCIQATDVLADPQAAPASSGGDVGA